jgi:hypothetical protein
MVLRSCLMPWRRSDPLPPLRRPNPDCAKGPTS